MKITISTNVINNSIRFARNVNEAYKDIIPYTEEFDHEFNMEDVKVITRKWGSISKTENEIIVDIKDSTIEDVLNVYENLYVKFAPIIGVAKSMIPMFKKYIVDVKDILNPLVEKYTEEYVYTVEHIKFSGVKAGYMILRKVKGDNDWNYVTSEVHWTDEFQTMDFKVRNDMLNQIVKNMTKTFNAEVTAGARTATLNIDNDIEAAHKFMSDFIKYELDPETDIITISV